MRDDAEVPVPKQGDAVGVELPPLAGSEPVTGDVSDGPAVDGEPKKRRRRRRTTAKPAETASDAPPSAEVQEAQLAQAITMGFEFGGRLAAGMRGDHWLFKPDETEMLGSVWAKALHPYMGAMAPYTPILVATIVTAGYMVPRIQEDRRIASERRIAGPVRIERATASVADVAVSVTNNGAADHPELRPSEPAPGTLGAETVQRSRRRGNTNPPGIS